MCPASHDVLSTAQGAKTGVYRGAESIATFGDLAAEFSAFHSGCALWHAEWLKILRISGPDRTRWLNGMVTNNARDLAPERGVYSFVLNAQGRILGDVYIYNRGESFSIVTEASQYDRLHELFDRFIIMDDVQLTRIESAAAICLRGPRLSQVLLGAGISVPEMAPLELREIPIQESELKLVAAESGPACEIWEEPAVLQALWPKLVAAGATRIGYEAVELARIARGVPAFGQDVRERDLPQETGQQRALHFNKGCYVGQEIVERIHSRGNVHRQFSGFTFAAAPPPPGTKIMADDKEAGEITSSATLPAPTGNRHVALGYLRREYALPGKPLTAGGQSATLTQLPFENL
jgi:aminomethyltransferase